MKLGVICEGERTDGPVLSKLLGAEFPAVTLEVVATSKHVIFSAVGALIDDLLAKGCERILIAWDLHPVGTQMSVSSQTAHADPCQRDQRMTLLTVAQRTTRTCQGDVGCLQNRYGFGDANATLEDSRICLVCFCESFDAVFLCDSSLLRELASSEIREADQPPTVRSAAKIPRPQQMIRQYFRRGHNKRLKYFNKYEHNAVLAQAFVDRGRLDRLRQHPGYRRLVTQIEAWLEAHQLGR